MKFESLLLLLLFGPSLVWADIYKTVDADGHVTYSSSPMRGGKKIILSPQAIPETRVQARSEPSAQQSFPRVNEKTQKSRDDKRRDILEEELNAELGLFNAAKQNQSKLENGRSVPASEREYQKVSKQVDLHQRNINALNIELSKLK